MSSRSFDQEVSLSQIKSLCETWFRSLRVISDSEDIEVFDFKDLLANGNVVVHVETKQGENTGRTTYYGSS